MLAIGRNGYGEMDRIRRTKTAQRDEPQEKRATLSCKLPGFNIITATQEKTRLHIIVIDARQFF